MSTPTLTHFLWQGKNAQGHKVQGELHAQSLAQARLQLKRQGVMIKKLRKKPQPLFGGKRITPADIAAFTRQLSTMNSAGVPLLQGLDIMIKGMQNPRLQALIQQIKTDIESGKSLTNSLRKHPKYFDALFCNLVNAGEQSGTLDTMLDRIAGYKEKTESLKKKIKKALFYPTAVIIIALVVTTIMLWFVIPKFDDMFQSAGAQLPAFTQIVVDLSNQLRQNGGTLLLGLIGIGVILFYAHKRSTAFRALLDRGKLHIPIIGQILRKAAIARYARTLSTTFAAGVPLVEALTAISGATGSIVYQEAVYHIRDAVTAGTPLNQAMTNTNVFPPMVSQMVAIGEESGSLDSMLDKVASIYEEDVDHAVEGLSSLLEPLIMVILGLLIGGLVVAMYLPIFKMGSAM